MKKAARVWPGDYCVRLVPLPGRVGGMVSEDEDGFYNVYINSQLNQEHQRRALKHELDHIADDDLNNQKPIREVESK